MISVIVPVYNVQRYLPRCVESILGQTYRDLEVILVDNGSTDRSGGLCDKYAKKDRRVRAIHVFPNQGVAAARNEGLKYTGGGYIAFVDSDDWLPRNALAELYDLIERNHADLAIAAHTAFGFRTKPERGYARSEALFHMGRIEDLRRFFVMDVKDNWRSPWAKLYRADLIKAHDVSFPNVTLGEDAVFVLRYLQSCGTVAWSDTPVYYYNRLVVGSAMTKKHLGYIDAVKMIMDLQLALVRGSDDETSRTHWGDILLQEFMIDAWFYTLYCADKREFEPYAREMLEYLVSRGVDCLTASGNSSLDADRRYLAAGDYGGLYHMLKGDGFAGEKGRFPHLRHLVRRALEEMTRIAVFDLRLGYRD